MIVLLVMPVLSALSSSLGGREQRLLESVFNVEDAGRGRRVDEVVEGRKYLHVRKHVLRLDTYTLTPAPEVLPDSLITFYAFLCLICEYIQGPGSGHQAPFSL